MLSGSISSGGVGVGLALIVEAVVASPSGPVGVGDGAGLPCDVETGLGVGVGVVVHCVADSGRTPVELKTSAVKMSTATATAADHRNIASVFGSDLFINSFFNQSSEP